MAENDETQEEQQTLTAEERRRNVRRVEDVVKRMDGMEKALVHVVLTAHGLYREIHDLRSELHEALGREAPPAPPSLIEEIGTAAIEGRRGDVEKSG